MAFVSLNEYGERSFTFARKPGADMYLTAAQVEAADISRFGIVHAGSCSLSGGSAAEATVYALKEAARQRKLVSFDVNYRDLLWDGDRAAAAKAVQSVLPYVDLLKVSDDETDMVGGEEVLPLLRERYGISAVVETLGRDGARCFFDGKTLPCPGHTFGCGGHHRRRRCLLGRFFKHALRGGRYRFPYAQRKSHSLRHEAGLRCGRALRKAKGCHGIPAHIRSPEQLS